MNLEFEIWVSYRVNSSLVREIVGANVDLEARRLTLNRILTDRISVFSQ
jgi:hypothetical protein